MYISFFLKLTNRLTSTRFAGVYLLLFALTIGAATFIENDFGTSAAQELIFKSRWFELLLLLFSTTILANMWRYRLLQQKKWAQLSFHLAIIIILFGAAVTRYTGTEGMMHIREGKTRINTFPQKTSCNFASPKVPIRMLLTKPLTFQV
jgi:hypothetical protein